MAEPSEQGACVPNIGPRQRTLRRVGGIVGVLLGVAGLLVLVSIDAPRWARLALFVPFVAGTTGIFQAREKT